MATVVELRNYIYLQVLDLLTTAAFLVNGVAEGNPVVRAAMKLGASPVPGLIGVKLLAVALGYVCWKTARPALLSRVNVFFALLVVWNLAALVITSAAR